MQFLLHDNAWSDLDAMGTGRACRCDLGLGEGGGGGGLKRGRRVLDHGQGDSDAMSKIVTQVTAAVTPAGWWRGGS